ncbi:ABC transporter ATP-binding protein [uncultured Microbulbifer sp.]|uniref:ABC transporter ATP-binding protein n=1 Tax=uncultured Microbulbifer sp. TaxID=348147 RepID=UPI0026186AA8|nr:ABC transporter ATP-binding protein [uncultured Microbulbifer sp.]
MNDTQPLIQLESLCRYFNSNGMETRAIHNLDLEIYPGEFVSISGPSGCGKSTLLSVLGLLDGATKGNYYLKQHKVEHFDLYQRAALRNKEIGFVFQAFNLIGDMTVFENVELPLTYSFESKSERKQRVMEKLDQVSMAHRENYYPAQLSGGQQQRVAVARGMIINPSILLADEPTGNLDSANGEEIMELLDQLNQQGTTICMVTHDSRFAQRATRTVELLDGQLLQ